jgi:hypothetical protein
MNRAKFWTHETIFVIALGTIMAGVFGTSFFSRQSPTRGSQVIEQMLDYEKACQTIRDQDVDNHIHNHC